MSNFELVSSANLCGIIPINKYQSKITGLKLCIAKVDGPLVNGYFCLATEAHDDDGLPHTLEHLVFLGSEKYPYKGMLDQFANRCLAQGSNAWTDTDHTCYTVTTAGSEGFLTLLPIYLDHVLYPTLTEAGYITEVHHINGEGDDAGVVYCEMQGRENSGHSRCHLEFIRSMYPGHCGYKSETGGIMKNLRETCSHKKVCDYHAEFYRPENLCLIITGNVEAEDVFKAIQPFEEKVTSKPPLSKYIRPWMNDVPPLDKNIDEKHILFPTEDESTGMVMIGWRGCHVTDFYTVTALQVLFTKYLTDSPIAPLQKELVEIDEPFCGDVSVMFFENRETAICIHADSVPKEKLFQIKDKVMEILQRIANGEEKIDMERMKTLLHRYILDEMNGLEENPHDVLALLSIGDFLFSEKEENLQEYVDRISRLKRLKDESEEFWVNLLKTYISDKKCVVTVADPSEEFMKKSGEVEKTRVKAQAEALGEDGLKSKKKILEDAIAENEIEPSKDIVASVQVPSTDSITFHKILMKSNQREDTSNDVFDVFPLDDVPCPFYVYHIKSFFTQIHLIIDCSRIKDDNIRMLIPLYTEILFESPLLIDGKVMPYEEVVKQLAADTLSTGVSLGLGGGRFSPGSFSKLLYLSITTENEKYEKAVEWLHNVLHNIQFSADRIKVIANKIVNDVASHKRNGRRVVSTLMHNISYTKESNSYVVNMIRQQNFLTQLMKDLEADPSKVLSAMEYLQESLLCRENYRFYVAGNLGNLPSNPRQCWDRLFFNDMPKDLIRGSKVPWDGEYLSGCRRAQIVGIGSVESSFLIQTCPGVNSYEDPDYPALLVFVEYLCAVEGPLWRKIRGLGLSYGYRIQVSPLTNNIMFILAKSTHVFNAYEKAKEIVEDYLSGKTKFDFAQVEAARSGMVFETIEKEKTLTDAVFQSMHAEFKKIPLDFNRSLLSKISSVSIDDLMRVGEKYFTKLFDSRLTSTAICCHPTKVSEVVESFKSIGMNFEVVESLENEFLEN